jgi:hypothetical protein
LIWSWAFAFARDLTQVFFSHAGFCYCVLDSFADHVGKKCADNRNIANGIVGECCHRLVQCCLAGGADGATKKTARRWVSSIPRQLAARFGYQSKYVLKRHVRLFQESQEHIAQNVLHAHAP